MTFLHRTIIALTVCSILVFTIVIINSTVHVISNNFYQLDIVNLSVNNIHTKNNLTNNTPIESQSQLQSQSQSQLDSDLRKQLIERSKQYLISIENNKSFSPELKKRLKLQSQNVVESGLNNLTNSYAVRQNLLQPADEQIDMVFFINALNKIDTDNNSKKHKKQKSITLNSDSNSNKNLYVSYYEFQRYKNNSRKNIKTCFSINNNQTTQTEKTSENSFKALSFLRSRFSQERKIYLPSVYEVILRVALPDNISFFDRIRLVLRRNINYGLCGNSSAFGAVGCGEIISNLCRRNLKSFVNLLVKNLNSVVISDCQVTFFSFRNFVTDKIIATNILVVKTTVLRN